jgi:nicotinate-nucleotide adenylyltransferase
LSRVGIYGGTFDPIHLGHLHVITQLIEKKLVDQLLVVPAGMPLLRANAPIATGQQRRTMCQLAVADLPSDIAAKVQVNPTEILRSGPSYAIDTVEAVAQNYPDDTIVLVIGQDAAEKLNQWHRID